MIGTSYRELDLHFFIYAALHFGQSFQTKVRYR
jgi:hypothetical protein